MFQDRSAAIADNEPITGAGAAVTPDSDGPLILITGRGCGNQLRSWVDGRLRDHACGIIADANRQAVGVAAADLDADGEEELYVHNTDTDGGACRTTDLLLDRINHNGRQVWCDAFAHSVNADRGNLTAGRSVAAIDRLGTGRYGMVVASAAATTRCYELGDDGEITDMADVVGLDISCEARSLIAAPLVTDRMDLFVGVDDGPNRLFRNDGGHFVDVAADNGVAAPAAATRGATVIDAGNGSFAIAVGSWETANQLFVPTQAGFADASPSVFAEPTRVRTLLAADFDNDGRQELFVNVCDGPNRLLAPVVDTEPVNTDDDSTAHVSPPAAWESRPLGAATDADGHGTGAVVADLDTDGSLELLVVHGDGDAQPLSLYDVSTDNDWLRVRPTTQHGAAARGVVVTLDTDRRRQRRVVDAGSGYLCQSEPVAHFGLGGATAPIQQPRRLTVRWLDGRERTVADPDPNTTHEIAHPAAE
jgi:ASPIC and UnbV.